MILQSHQWSLIQEDSCLFSLKLRKEMILKSKGQTRLELRESRLLRRQGLPNSPPKGLTVSFRRGLNSLSSNLQFSCFGLPTVHHHTWLEQRRFSHTFTMGVASVPSIQYHLPSVTSTCLWALPNTCGEQNCTNLRTSGTDNSLIRHRGELLGSLQ